jgi:murein L,D-transpeptidase YcbB/YkuD
VEIGDSADIVLALRERLRQSLSREERRLAREGRASLRYDSALAASVEHFQSRHGIAVDGILGPDTFRELNTEVESRIAAVRTAMERWRWLPANPGTDALPGSPAVLVNTAGRRVHILENGVPEVSMKVIVGQRDWKTTLFEDAMERMVVNPYWNVPRSILEEETLPKAAQDPSYLRRNDFEVVDSEGGVVPLDAIDWRGVDPASFPHRIRQRPGEKNSLGRVKFLFPNRFAIYLHDTPADQLFDERVRTFSHGCIRVERPREFAHYLMGTATDVAPTRFDELKASQERHVVGLEEPIPTYVVYQTVWVDGDGVPTFTPDIYDRDERVREAMAALDGRTSAGTAGAGP